MPSRQDFKEKKSQAGKAINKTKQQIKERASARLKNQAKALNINVQ